MQSTGRSFARPVRSCRASAVATLRCCGHHAGRIAVKITGPLVLGAAMVAIPALLVGLYVMNPLHSVRGGPLMRITGYTMFGQSSEAMLPTLKRGEFFFATAWPYATGNPQRGDVIVFQYPPNPSVEYAKRVIAVGGEVVELRHCVVFINGRQIDEPYVERSRATKSDSCDMERVAVPADNFFVLGDNRDNSEDSRYWGFVPRGRVIGKVLH